jgi:predicted esterase
MLSMLVAFVPSGSIAWADDGEAAIDQLRKWLLQAPEHRGNIEEQPFAAEPLSQSQSQSAQAILWKDHVAKVKSRRSAVFQARVVKHAEYTMKYAYSVHGKPGVDGRRLFISLHGGGGTSAAVNERQWQNQKRLYRPDEGVYLAPRAPTDSWNMWHQSYMDPMLDRLIADLIILENVDPNRVYLLGYSAGGDGVYQLGPRFADRLAAAATMAGHPNEASPLGLYNLPFAIYCGGKDSAYDRNKVAADWGQQLDELSEREGGYPHVVKIYPDKGHWMDREDREAIPWLAAQQRDPLPRRIVWQQDDVVGTRFYWLATTPTALGTDPKSRTPEVRTEPVSRALIDVRRDGQTFQVTQSNTVCKLQIRLSDQMADLDEPIRVIQRGQVLFAGTPSRTIATIAKTIREREDPASIFPAEIEIEIDAD